MIACQREEIPDSSFGEDSENEDVILSINNLTFQDIQEKTKLNTAVKEINEITKSNYTTRSTNSESNHPESKDTSPIQSEYATEIISSKNKTFTFQLTKKEGAEDNPAVYNIVFVEQDEGDFKTIGVKYDFSEEQAEIFHNTGKIEGEVRVIFFEIKNFKDKPNYTTRAASGDNICENIEGGMDCGSLEEVIINGGGGSDGGGIGGIGGSGGNSSGGEGDVDTEAVEPIDLPRGGHTTPVVDEDKNLAMKLQHFLTTNIFKINLKNLRVKQVNPENMDIPKTRMEILRN